MIVEDHDADGNTASFESHDLDRLLDIHEDATEAAKGLGIELIAGLEGDIEANGSCDCGAYWTVVGRAAVEGTQARDGAGDIARGFMVDHGDDWGHARLIPFTNGDPTATLTITLRL
jgi:hypothetical protein